MTGLSFRFPITMKLVLMTAGCIALVVGPVAYNSSKLFESTLRQSQYDANSQLAQSKSQQVQALISNEISKVQNIINNLNDPTTANLRSPTLSPASRTSSSNVIPLQISIERDPDILNIEIFELRDAKIKIIHSQFNKTLLKKEDLPEKWIHEFRKSRAFHLPTLFSSAGIRVQNSTLDPRLPSMTIGISYADPDGIVRHAALADLTLSRLQRVFQDAGVRQTYLIDSQGIVLAHPDDQLVIGKKSFSDLPIVSSLFKTGLNIQVGDKRFFDPHLKRQVVASFSKTMYGVSVIAQAPEDLILEPSHQVQVQSFTVAGYVLSIAIFFVFLFSLSITLPIEKLHEATQIIASGRFNIRARIRSNDEVGDLAHSFNKMVAGLEEREKMRNILNKFHGSSVTEDLLKNDLQLGGSKKDVVVFFSDIRDFTHFSENHTPEQVVEMLNEYFHTMVSIITHNGGIVDKFVGDAIMAIWGVPKSSGNDCNKAVEACLQMRVALHKLNEKRIARKESPLKIGMGLHMGPAISGKIGSTERMEYTVIGDTVNMASRIESSTKAFGADLLVSDSVQNAVQAQFIFEFAGQAQVKGKSDALSMYKVRGRISASGEPQIIQTPYSDYSAQAAEKVKLSVVPKSTEHHASDSTHKISKAA